MKNAAYGSSVRAAVEPLASNYAIDLFGAQIRSSNAEAIVVTADMLGNSAEKESAPRIERDQNPVSRSPASFAFLTMIRQETFSPAKHEQRGPTKWAARRR